MNKRYELYLEGRPSPSQDYPDNHNWAYEFSTPAENFQLHIEVPDPDPDKGIKGLTKVGVAKVFKEGDTLLCTLQ